MSLSDDKPLVLFDGECALCQGFVGFVTRHDPHQQFTFIPRTSDAGRQASVRCGITDDVKSVILITGGNCYIRSDASLRILRRLNWPYSWAYAMVMVPKGLRDWGYDWVSRNRYRFFGKVQACPLPPHAASVNDR